ncbi:MAG: GNAT family N-acetyltransferase [Firmicutes bacterium]|nr:GNAT family N-acetyltransferase [Bacillota bacterium]
MQDCNKLWIGLKNIFEGDFLIQAKSRVQLRPITESDLYALWEMSAKEEAPEWKKWDAPYYPYTPKTYEEFLKNKAYYLEPNRIRGIEVNNELIGIVSYYWEHEPSKWLEMGITIFKPSYWSGGYGTDALKQWMDILFTEMPLVRVGFTTWSGNERMVKVGEKLGMTMEARIRKVRFYNDVYYDSIRMGILREEWEALN